MACAQILRWAELAVSVWQCVEHDLRRYRPWRGRTTRLLIGGTSAPALSGGGYWMSAADRGHQRGTCVHSVASGHHGLIVACASGRLRGAKLDLGYGHVRRNSSLRLRIIADTLSPKPTCYSATASFGCYADGDAAKKLYEKRRRVVPLVICSLSLTSRYLVVHKYDDCAGDCWRD